jgi:hypothetical protein
LKEEEKKGKRILGLYRMRSTGIVPFFLFLPRFILEEEEPFPFPPSQLTVRSSLFSLSPDKTSFTNGQRLGATSPGESFPFSQRGHLLYLFI